MPARLPPARRVWVWLHRWVGLAMALFLVIVGLTGSVLAFNNELEHVFAPRLFATPQPGVPKLSLATLAERAALLVPQARVEAVLFTELDQASIYYTPRTNPATGQPYELAFDEFFVDPWTGRELGRRRSGDLSQGQINLVPFIYKLHWRLALGEFGQWVLGIVAILWTLDCFNGLYLTLPTTLKAFWRRWRPAWQVKRGASVFRLNFDLHRAGGLWVWLLLLVFAWSSVMMNIRPAYEWVMTGLFDYHSDREAFMSSDTPRNSPKLDWHAAQAVGEQLMAEQSRLHDFKVGEPLGLMYFAGTGAYLYDVRGSRDVFERSPKGGGTSVMFDGETGALRELMQPTGEHTGNTVESWLYALHMARVFGMPYRVFVCVLGGLVAMLSVTGVYIWWVKRRGARRGLSSVDRRVGKRVFSAK